MVGNMGSTPAASTNFLVFSQFTDRNQVCFWPYLACLVSIWSAFSVQKTDLNFFKNRRSTAQKNGRITYLVGLDSVLESTRSRNVSEGTD